jgi:voltage-gated potassium channel
MFPQQRADSGMSPTAADDSSGRMSPSNSGEFEMANATRNREKEISKRPVRLRIAHAPRLGRYLRSIATETRFLQIIGMFIALWMLFATGLYFAEQGFDGSAISSYGESLYWGVAAFSTAGIADTPASGLGQLIGAVWIVTGSVIFFGAIVATVTSYFMRPVQRPARQIVDTIEYNLEHMQDLTLEELELLKKTTDALILHMEQTKT